MYEKTTTFNLIGSIEVAIQKGTEEVNLSEILKETTTIIIKGDNFEAQIIFMPRTSPRFKEVARLGLVIKENI